ncbi:hypothetical protein AB1Y20_006683 [Prymnesium parvum]|uniref:Uncharacterized protein n=1 Tax=Prymnesium parvum TaxID=97485 RepID=A0AB34IYS6_PRYPA|mmetsp:Transcript_1805/g.4551  ORF Transcript_1805/g.4551 Transcript_1805/m.4551 type:complete len:145 (+) Transcript_1805:313-747(+)
MARAGACTRARLPDTAKQRRRDMKTAEHRDALHAERPHSVVHAEQEMSRCHSRSTNNERFAEYVRTRHEHSASLQELYESVVYRERAWSRKIRKQQSLALFIQRIVTRYGARRQTDHPRIWCVGEDRWVAWCGVQQGTPALRDC